MRRLTVLAAFCMALAAGCQAQPVAPSARRQPVSAAGLEQRSLVIRSGRHSHRFLVEVARDAAQQQHGLMFRRSLPADGGMLFPFAYPREAVFWMKNTLIPLDMIFIRPDGTIARIAAMTVPETLDPVDSGEPVSAVLEIAGGRAAQLRIRPGDRVIWTR